MELAYCFLEKFNNYFNRKIIKYNSIDDYLEHSNNSFIPLDGTGNISLFNFDPNDNVMTAIVCNDVPFDPDYFLLIDKQQNIKQRWFVIEQKRNRQGQWLYTLKRDVISDNINSLIKAPIFVQKGMLSEDDPFILNSEGMDFNQVKKSEFLLKDLTESSWIVCYLAKSLSATNINVDTKSEAITPDYVTLTEIANELGIAESDLASALNINPGDTNVLTITKENQIEYSYLTGALPGYTTNVNFKSNTSFTIFYDKHEQGAISPNYQWLFYGGSYLSSFQNQIRINANNIVSSMPALIGRNYYLDSTHAQEVLSRYSGRVILYLGNYYTLSVSYSGVTANSHVFQPINNALWNTICENTGGYSGTMAQNAEMNIKTNDIDATLTLSTYTPAVIKYEVTISSSRKVCDDQEYDIVAIPASDITIRPQGPNFTQDGSLAQLIASALAIKEGTNIYDIQLLPYCPRPDMLYGNNVLNLADFNVNEDFDFIQKTEGGISTNIGVVIYVEKASFKHTIYKSLGLNTNKKIDSQCDFYRLVSPNYQGSFEFNVAKNGGSVEYFNVYCTYKPYTPFIKVTPNLKYLYGEDFNDNRGLLCSGDFSLPRVSSAWQQYQLENKNYQNIFNREIQNMNFMQSIEMRNQRVSGAVGIVSDIAKGAGAGLYVGGGAGALLGGVVGGVTSGIGYAIDTDTLAKTHRETKQLAIDKFNYQLGNIKALPYTLTKVGAFDISSKIFPFLEYYTCTDKEKDALINKIKYESMTVMRIGTLEEFMNFNGTLNYFKGELIRNDEIADDSHVLNAIYEEFLKGVYI